MEIWGHAGDSLIHPLFFVQKKIVRIIIFSVFLAHDTAPIFLNQRLLPLNKIVLHRTSVFMFKLMNNMLPNAMNFLIVRNNDYHTVKSIIQYYNYYNSPVYTCFLDASKAFDRINQ